MNKEDFTKTIEALDFNKCRKHVEKVLGYDIRDTLGKFKEIKTTNRTKSVEYRDWWHWFIRQQNIHNGCLVFIGYEMLEDEDDPAEWVNEITKCFITEFGDEQMYWVEW